MQVAKTIKSIRALAKTARGDSLQIGLVPTMGALHIGHISLIETAVKQCDFVVVSIFVNPTQFAPGEDFEQYPRPLAADLDICEKAGVDAVFVPTAEIMYPCENLTWVNVEKLAEPLCGKSRPSFFRGVATVCAKLFNIVQPNKAFFGQKDAQQAIIIRRMVADLKMPLEIVICPTVRQSDGLAVSSRNQYLTKQQKTDATVLYKSLRKCRDMADAGVTDAREIIAEMRKILTSPASAEIDYIGIVDAETLQPSKHIAGKLLIAVAVKIGSTRLIDNIILDAGGT